METPLTDAIDRGDLELAARLLRSGEDPNQPNGFGESPLMVAAMSRSTSALELLAAHGAEVNRSYKDGWTAFTLPSITLSTQQSRRVEHLERSQQKLFFGYSSMERISAKRLIKVKQHSISQRATTHQPWSQYCEGLNRVTRAMPNPSIERTPSGRLRPPTVAAHVKR